MTQSHQFRTTRWTQVMAARDASPGGRQALRDLCESYYEPVALFIQRSGLTGHNEARDLAHEFFARLLEGDQLDQVDRTRGRFRSYLLGALKHFLSDHRDRDRARKRGGGVSIVSLSQDLPCVEPAVPSGLPPDAYFDRQWGLALVEQAFGVLRAEAEAEGELSRFEVLRPWLVVPSGHDTALAAARTLQLTEGAFKVAVHRLRKRFRQVVLDRVRATVDDPAEVHQELEYLIQTISARSNQ